jgi:hypothetical protein
MGCMRYFDSGDMSMDLDPAEVGDNHDSDSGVGTFHYGLASRMMQYDQMAGVVTWMISFLYHLQILNRLPAFRAISADVHVSSGSRGPSNVDRIELHVNKGHQGWTYSIGHIDLGSFHVYTVPIC